MVPHRSWDWIRSHYPIQPGYLDEVEGYLKNGERANLVRGETVVEMPDDMEFPEKYKEAE